MSEVRAVLVLQKQRRSYFCDRIEEMFKKNSVSVLQSVSTTIGLRSDDKFGGMMCRSHRLVSISICSFLRQQGIASPTYAYLCGCAGLYLADVGLRLASPRRYEGARRADCHFSSNSEKSAVGERAMVVLGRWLTVKPLVGPKF